ncbi:MAG: BrnT family toxin [Desulfobacterales bacterium]|nr:BrnT family toxin [Desulfobacterales bacterium]
MVQNSHFEWDPQKDQGNQAKHNVSFALAQQAFLDPERIILKDLGHSKEKDRYYCLGWVDNRVLTVRFTYRAHRIRIFGAGYWRKGRKIYEKENHLHR